VSDWLDIDNSPVVASNAGLPAVVAIPDDYQGRVALAEQCWARLTSNQKLFLQAWRDCRYNARAACKRVGLSENSRPNTRWMQEPDYAMVVRIWRANAAASALDKDRLLARHDGIVEGLLEPQTKITRDGLVVDASPDYNGAARANETLMQAAGVLKSGKDSDINVNVGVALQVGPPTLNIQVMPLPPSKSAVDESVVIDAKFTEVPNEDWLDA
jgi:hypothetical protein